MEEIEIECMVCGKKNTNLFCPLCNYRAFGIYGSDDDAFAEAEANEYRANMLEPVRIKIPVYSYKNKIKIENRRLIIEEPDKDEIIIEGKNMEINKPVWFDEEFCNPNREMPLAYELVDIDGKSESHHQVFENPELDDETVKIGMILRPELKLNVIVGKDEKYVCSKLYPLK